MRKYKLILTVIIAFVVMACPAFAAFGPSESNISSKVMLSVDKLRAGDAFELAVVANVEPHYHVGAHDSSLYPARLTLVAPKGVSFEEPVYPKGELMSFPFAPDEKIPVYEGEFVIRVKGRVTEDAEPGRVVVVSKLDTQACKGEQCYAPSVSEAKLDVEVVGAGESVSPANDDVFAKGLAGSSGSGPTSEEPSGLIDWLVSSGGFLRFPLLFLAGLLLAFTPCIYPMIPVTVGFFSAQSEVNRRRVPVLAAVYVLGLALTYSILGVVAALSGGVFGAAMQKPVVIGLIAAILVALALSMFGLYEMKPPAFVANRASGRGGIVGALVMGLIFGIVAAPCAGPAVIGLMVIVANIGSPVMGFLMFFALALGLGTPLFFLAAFSAKMPLPGMWMVAVKKIAGFMLLGAAAYFARPVLPDSVNTYLLPAIVLAAGLYLGFFENSIKSSKVGSSLGKAGSVAAVALVVMMLGSGASRVSLEWEPYTSNAIAQAAAEGRPSMVEFTAAWCGVCKEMEHGPFSDPKVIKAAERFARFKVDGTDVSDREVRAVIDNYGVQGFPTILFFDSKGREVESARVVGFLNSPKLIERMDAVE